MTVLDSEATTEAILLYNGFEALSDEAVAEQIEANYDGEYEILRHDPPSEQQPGAVSFRKLG